jgi:hypothetical protein
VRLLDIIKNSGSRYRETDELYRLQSRLHSLSGAITEKREDLVRRIAAETISPNADERLAGLLRDVVAGLLTFEGLFIPPANIRAAELSTAQTWELLKVLRRQLAALEEPATQERIAEILVQLVGAIVPDHLPPQNKDDAPSLSAPLISLLPYPAGAIEGAIAAVLGEPPDQSPPSEAPSAIRMEYPVRLRYQSAEVE